MGRGAFAHQRLWSVNVISVVIPLLYNTKCNANEKDVIESKIGGNKELV